MGRTLTLTLALALALSLTWCASSRKSGWSVVVCCDERYLVRVRARARLGLGLGLG